MKSNAYVRQFTILYLTKARLRRDIEGADKPFEYSAEKWHQNSCTVVSNCNGWAARLINPPYQQHIACLHQNSPDLSKPASSPGPLFSTYLEKTSFHHSPRGTCTWPGCRSTAEMTQGMRGFVASQETARVQADVCATPTLGWARVLVRQALWHRRSHWWAVSHRTSVSHFSGVAGLLPMPATNLCGGNAGHISLGHGWHGFMPLQPWIWSQRT